MENKELQKKVKELRSKNGFSQEDLAEKTGLSLRTIQRIENGETMPRGDTLKRLATTLHVSPDAIIEWKIQEDDNVIRILNLSQLAFIAFPILGIIIPLSIWILKKDTIKYVDFVGKAILNFQMTWTIVLCFLYAIVIVKKLFYMHVVTISSFAFSLPYFVGGLYIFNLILIIINTILFTKKRQVKYIPAIKFLN